MERIQRILRLEVEELEERIAPAFLGMENSRVLMHGHDLGQGHLHVPNGDTVDIPNEAAKDGLKIAAGVTPVPP